MAERGEGNQPPTGSPPIAADREEGSPWTRWKPLKDDHDRVKKMLADLGSTTDELESLGGRMQAHKEELHAELVEPGSSSDPIEGGLR